MSSRAHLSTDEFVDSIWNDEPTAEERVAANFCEKDWRREHMKVELEKYINDAIEAARVELQNDE